MVRSPAQDALAKTPRTPRYTLSILFFAVAHAATFSQTNGIVPADILDDGILITANTLSFARTLNGIPFVRSDAGLNDWTNAGLGWCNLCAAPFQSALSFQYYQEAPDSPSITFPGLTVGATYRAQVLMANTTNQTGWATTASMQGDSYTMTNWGATQPVNLTVEFVATGTTEVLAFPFTTNSEPARAVINAYTLHQIADACVGSDPDVCEAIAHAEATTVISPTHPLARVRSSTVYAQLEAIADQTSCTFDGGWAGNYAADASLVGTTSNGADLDGTFGGGVLSGTVDGAIPVSGTLSGSNWDAGVGQSDSAAGKHIRTTGRNGVFVGLAYQGQFGSCL